jgi:pimeloyl-ACP methyl ester carboxylesterase
VRRPAGGRRLSRSPADVNRGQAYVQGAHLAGTLSGAVSTYVLIPGAGSDAWFWHLVDPLLRDRGHDVVTMDLPCQDESAGLAEYTDVVLDAIGERTDLIVVGQSLGGLTAPLVCARRPADLLVFVNGMVPRPGESDWWESAGYPLTLGPDFDPIEIFLHDVPSDVVAASEAHVLPQAGTPMEEPWPLDALPDVPTGFIMSRDDRFFPADWQREVVRDRLGIEPDEIDGGHCPSLSRPAELVDALEALRVRLSVQRDTG